MKNLSRLLLAGLLFFVLTSEDGCEETTKNNKTSNSGVSEVSTKVQTGIDGKTIEQENIINRLAMDNKPGSIKHLYVISAYSGQVILYSTVKGKVTSSGKRLSPLTLAVSGGSDGMRRYYHTDEIQDDGTYGSSVEYLYWWDSKGVYHQQYVTGGMILHISDQPIAIKSVILNLETVTNENK